MEIIYNLWMLFAVLVNNDIIYIPFLMLLSLALDKRAAYYFIFAVLLVTILKPVLAEPRPCKITPSCEPGYGFPSGHVTLTAAVAFSQIRRKRFLPLFLFTLLVAYSRVFLGVHSLGQVVAGIAFASFILEVDKLLRWTHRWDKETYVRPFLRRLGLWKS